MGGGGTRETRVAARLVRTQKRRSAVPAEAAASSSASLPGEGPAELEGAAVSSPADAQLLEAPAPASVSCWTPYPATACVPVCTADDFDRSQSRRPGGPLGQAFECR